MFTPVLESRKHHSAFKFKKTKNIIVKSVPILITLPYCIVAALLTSEQPLYFVWKLVITNNVNVTTSLIYTYV